MGKLLRNLDSYNYIQLCCFIAGIYVCVHLFVCQNKSTCFQKLKSSNVFYARSRQMMPVAGAILIYTNKAKRLCLRVCPEWPTMSCMEWLPALGIQG